MRQLKVGDTIQCLNMLDLSEHCNGLIKAGYKLDVDLRKSLIMIRATPEDLKGDLGCSALSAINVANIMMIQGIS